MKGRNFLMKQILSLWPVLTAVRAIRSTVNTNMSDGAVISCSMQSDDRWILHRDRQQPRKNTLRACSAIIAFPKRFRAVINRCPDIGIASKICDAPFAFEKFWMIPRTNRVFFSKCFRMGNWTNELQPDFPSVFESAPVKHIETSNTYEAASGGRFDIGVNLPARITRYSGKSF